MKVTTCDDGGEDCVKPYYTLDKFHRDGIPYGFNIEMFVVPKADRGNGVGTAMYEKFESELPESVKIVNLIAADLGTGNTRKFWEKMGFALVFDLPVDEQIASSHIYQHMHKGVNGYPTPRTLPATSYDEEYYPEYAPDMRSAARVVSIKASRP